MTQQPSRLLLLDIGNTAASYAIYTGGRLLRHGSSHHNNIPKLIKNWSKSGVKYDNHLVISSVVPKITSKIKKYAPVKKNLKLWIAGQNLPVPVDHKYKYPNKLGADRLVNIYGALRIYGAPFLILDFGTALTVDYVSRKGIFEGGLIIPGPELGFQTLLARAAMIPKNLRLPKKRGRLLGRTTYECLSSGILEGFGAMTDELIRRFKKEYGKNTQVIVTGGFTENIRPYARNLEIIDKKHTLKSLLILFKDHCSKRPPCAISRHNLP